jgi:cytochrome c biogenesis protein CcmG, thiol:disulfide interchange protein DsbE
MKRWLPLVGFLVLVGFFAKGLFLNPREVPSPLIGKPAPVFSLPVVGDAQRAFSPADMKGQVWLLNVWAPWCVSCRGGAQVPDGAGREPHRGRPSSGSTGRTATARPQRLLARTATPMWPCPTTCRAASASTGA